MFNTPLPPSACKFLQGALALGFCNADRYTFVLDAFPCCMCIIIHKCMYPQCLLQKEILFSQTVASFSPINIKTIGLQSLSGICIRSRSGRMFVNLFPMTQFILPWIWHSFCTFKSKP